MIKTFTSVVGFTAVVSAAGAAATVAVRAQQGAVQMPEARSAPDDRRSRHVPDEEFIRFPLPPGDEAYASIDGRRLKQYVGEITAIARRYRDRGHQYWGRIMGTEADAETADWMADKFRTAGLEHVRIQPLDLPPQWMPQSWEVVVSSAGRSVTLRSAQPESRLPAELSGDRNLEAVYVGWGHEADFAGKDVRGKAVFIYSMPMPGVRNTSATRNDAAGRAIARGAAAVFNVVELPGNVSGMWSFTGQNRGKVPAFLVGSADGASVREMIEEAPAGQAPRVGVRLDIKMVPGLKTANVWGEVPGTTDEKVMIVAHRDAFFEGADDNGSGMATLLGLAEYFAKVPRDRRRRTIQFVGTSGHHGTAAGVQWMADHKEAVFGKTALIINCEHTALTAVYGFAGATKSNSIAAKGLYVTPGPLTPIVLTALRSFGVPTYAGISERPAGEIGRVYQFAPSMQLIDASLYYHTDAETAELIPAAGLEAVTRAYAKVIDEVNNLSLHEVRGRAASPTNAR